MEFRTIRNATLAIFILWSIIGVTTIPVWMSHKLEVSNLLTGLFAAHENGI